MENCIQSALDDDLRPMELELPKRMLHFQNLCHLLSLVKLYSAFGKKWGEGVRFESALRTLEETVYTHCLEIHILSLSIMDANFYHGKKHHLYYRVKDFLKEKNESILQGMQELHEILYNDSLHMQSKSSAPPIEMEELLGMLDSLIQTLGYFTIKRIQQLRKSLELSKNIIRFAIFRGLEQRQMGDMLFHVQCVLVDSARFILMCSYLIDNSEFEQLVGRLKPVEYHVCRIYARVLEEASKLSQSSSHSKLGSHSLIFDMVDSLISVLLELFCNGTSSIYIFDHQVHSLYEGLGFLKSTLTEKLYEKMHITIQVFLCKAGIIVSYLSVRKHNHHVVEQLQHLFFDVEKKIKLIDKDTQDAPRYPLQSATSYFPQTNLLGFIDSILGKIKLVNFHGSVVASEKNEFVTIHTELQFLISSLVSFVGRHEENGKFQALWSHVAAVAYETEFVLDSLIVGGAIQSFAGILRTIIEHIKVVKGEISKVFSIVEQITKVQEFRIKIPSLGKTPELNGQVVGMDDEVQNISDRITRGTKQLDIVSIVGMAGLGKTTPAKKLYHHPSITHHFHVHAWCTVSQEYDKKHLLIEILSSLSIGFDDKYSEMSEDDLANAIRKHLKMKRYLIILDDVWDTEACGSLKLSFPDDAVES